MCPPAGVPQSCVQGHSSGADQAQTHPVSESESSKKHQGGTIGPPQLCPGSPQPLQHQGGVWCPAKLPPCSSPGQGQGRSGRCRDLLPSVPKSWHDRKAWRGKHKAEGQVLTSLRTWPRGTWAEMSPSPGLCPEPHTGMGQAGDRHVFLCRRGLALGVAPFQGHGP